MRKISKSTIENILKKTPWAHSSRPKDEGLSEEQIKGLFYKALTDEDNSLVAEINRIVEECNDELSKIDVTEHFGKLENLIDDKPQEWIRIRQLLYYYGEIPTFTQEEVNAYNDVTNLKLGKNVVFKLTAPEGIIPDQALTLTIGSDLYTGLELLRNTAGEALDGLFYMYIAVNPEAKSIPISIKWTRRSDTQKMLFDFAEMGVTSGSVEVEEKPKKVVLRFSRYADGSSNSAAFADTMQYIGVRIADEDEPISTNKNDYYWYKYKNKNFAIVSFACTITPSMWNATTKQYNVQLADIKSDNFVLISPKPQSMDLWVRCGIRAVVQADRYVTMQYDELPNQNVYFNLAIGDYWY